MFNSYFKEGSLPGTDYKAYVAIHESMSPFMGTTEYLHDSMEHGNASRFCLRQEIDDKGRSKTTITDNGNGMSKEIFETFISSYKSHKPVNQIIKGSSIAEFGFGSKDADIYFANPGKGQVSRCTYRSYSKKGDAYEWVWDICASDPGKGRYGREIKEITNPECKTGLVITIDNARPLTETEIETIKTEISRSFTKDVELPVVSIGLGEETLGHKISFVDPMHFDLFPTENEKTFRNCKDGIYVTKEAVWCKKTIKAYCEDESTGKTKSVKIPVITAYFNEDYWKKYRKNDYDKILSKFCGVYALKGNTYLTRGGNLTKMFNITPNCGGTPRIRQCVIIDDTNEFIFEIKSMKMLGVKPFAENHLMKNVYKDENGVSVYDAIKAEYQSFGKKFHDWVRNCKGEYSHGDYKNGFPKIDTFLKDYEEFKNGLKYNRKNADDFGEFMPSPESMVYELNGHEYAACKTISIDDNFNTSWNYSMNIEIGNEVTKEDVLYSALDVLRELEISVKDYRNFAKLMAIKLHHHEA